MAQITQRTTGFGVALDEVDPQQFVVRIGAGTRDAVEIVEDYGISGPHLDATTGMQLDRVVRCRLAPNRWRTIAQPLKRVFNERLKGRNMSPGKWEVRDNPVHRLLGREMCVLAWAVESCGDELVPVAVEGWIALRPEERWWLYAMAVHATGGADDRDKGWRKAIRIGLTEGSGSIAPVDTRQMTFGDV